MTLTELFDRFRDYRVKLGGLMTLTELFDQLRDCCVKLGDRVGSLENKVTSIERALLYDENEKRNIMSFKEEALREIQQFDVRLNDRVSKLEAKLDDIQRT